MQISSQLDDRPLQNSAVIPTRIVGALLVGVAFSILAFSIAWTLENDAIATDLEVGAIDRFNVVQNALVEQTRLLESVSAYFEASPDVDLESFKTFVTRLLPHSPQLQAIGYAPLVLQAERDSIERMAAGQHGVLFRILERDAEGQLRPASLRADYTPVLYIEPIVSNEAALGFDLSSESTRRTTLEAARDSGQSQTTPGLRLVQDERSRIGLLSALPIYRPGAQLQTVSDRRAALKGFTTQVYWIDVLIEGGLSHLQPGGVDLYFYDPSDPPNAGPLYVHTSRTREPGSAPAPHDIADNASQFVFQGTLDIGSRNLRVVASATPGFVAVRRGLLTWVLLAGGLFATTLSAAYVIVSARRDRLLRQAHHDLEISAERLRDVLENMPVLMIASDADGDLIAWNRECERVSGYSAAEVLGSAAVPNPDIPNPIVTVERTARSGPRKTFGTGNGRSVLGTGRTAPSPGQTFQIRFRSLVGIPGSSASMFRNERRSRNSSCIAGS